MLDPQIVEQAERLPGEPAELGMVPFALQLADDDQRQYHLVLAEPRERSGIGEQHGRVEDEGSTAAIGISSIMQVSGNGHGSLHTVSRARARERD
jgi:hypothetical protein